MKRIVFRCLCLCLCLCLSLASCGTPAPEESSLPEESEEISLPEDPNAKAVRAELEELLETEWSAGDEPLEWLTAERVETIREQVKKLKAPILRSEDVFRIAERAAAFYFAAWEGKQMILLPACGVLAAVRGATGTFQQYSEYAAAYDALLAYTLYLFTPPEYVFWGSDIWDGGWYSSDGTQFDLSAVLCLPLAGDYASRMGALTAIRESQSCIRLYPLSVSNGEHPLDFSHCAASDLLQNGEPTALELSETTAEGDAALMKKLRELYATGYVRKWLNRLLKDRDTGVYLAYDLPNGEVIDVYLPFSAKTMREIREKVEQMPAPILTVNEVQALMTVISTAVYSKYPLLLPGIDGAADVLLPAGIEKAADVSGMSTADVLVMQHRATAYLIHLFTPSSYRSAYLYSPVGTCYELSSDGGRQQSVVVSEAYKSGPGTLQYLSGALT